VGILKNTSVFWAVKDEKPKDEQKQQLNRELLKESGETGCYVSAQS